MSREPRLEAEFACGCAVVLGEVSVMVQPCSLDCPNYLLAMLELERSVRQLRIMALGRGLLPIAGGSL